MTTQTRTRKGRAAVQAKTHPDGRSGRGKRKTAKPGDPIPAHERSQSCIPGIHNADIARMFNEVADLLELEDASTFRVRAYRNAARIVGDLGREVGAMVEAGEALRELPGIGKDLEGKIRQIVLTSECDILHELHERVPPGMASLLHLSGLGPKRVRKLNEALGAHTTDDLGIAARQGKIRTIPGFGEKTEQRILKAIEAKESKEARFKFADVMGHAESLVEYLKSIPGVTEATVAGSFRRCKETVADLDVVVVAEEQAEVMDHVVAFDEVASVAAKGRTRATMMLRSSLQVDVRVMPRASYGAAMHYFTGSKAHNIAVRRLGQDAGLKINEYGVFRNDERVAGDTEQSVFASVGLAFIAPELREDRGEIQAAQSGRLPRLVERKDIRGDLHAHSNATGGHNTIRQMAEAALARGFEYLAMTDHSPRVAVVRGLDPQRLLAQIEAIDRLNEELHGITVLKGIEVDILDDGKLDLPNDILGRLDLVVGAVHSRFDLPREAQTARIQKAMDHPHFSILAHPTGRLIQERDPCDLDMVRIIRHAKQRGCFLEINAHPSRLDLPDIYAQIARDEGVLVAVNTDAHSAADLNNLRFGISQARRGWLEPADVLNTRPLPELKRLLRRTT